MAARSGRNNARSGGDLPQEPPRKRAPRERGVDATSRTIRSVRRNAKGDREQASVQPAERGASETSPETAVTSKPKPRKSRSKGSAREGLPARAADIRARIETVRRVASAPVSQEDHRARVEVGACRPHNPWRARRRWVTALALLASSGALVAADLPSPRILKSFVQPEASSPAPVPTPPPEAPPDQAPPLKVPALQPGFYMTGALQAARGASEHVAQRVVPISHGSFALSGPAAGLGVGYRIKSGDWMYGLEVDHARSSVKGYAAGSFSHPCSASVIKFDGACATHLRSLSTARLIVGRNLSFAMFYVTGGFAWGSVVGERAYAKASSLHRGWTIGAGLEMPLTEKLSAKAEFLHVNLGARQSYPDLCGCRPYKVSASANIFRIGFNYAF